MLQEWGLGMRLGLVAGVPSMWANQIAEFKTSSYNLIGWLIDHNYIRFLRTHLSMLEGQLALLLPQQHKHSLKLCLNCQNKTISPVALSISSP